MAQRTSDEPNREGPGLPFVLTVTQAQAGRTVRSILESQLRLSRRALRSLITTEGVMRNGAPVYLTARVEAGDTLAVWLPVETTDLIASPQPLQIAYEDSEVLVVDKPAGVLSHPTSRERTGSILDAVYAHIAPLVPHCVHRLDRDTSGLLLLAKHAHFHHLFDEALRRGDVHRAYLAIVHLASTDPSGNFGAGASDWETIDLPIAQAPNAPSRRVISATGQRAVTHYRVLARAARSALVMVVLETGRTHQIRVHFAAVGQPLWGDPAYGPRRDLESPDGQLIARQALHAAWLWFRHPVTGHETAVFAPPPTDMRQAWCALGGQVSDWPRAEDCNPLVENCPIFDTIDHSDRKP
ncbi:MAG: RluA family pseudouridine synthase [Alicyclobacillus sp.]|nr:RluA family pseudouridine synthase [Alicyclobacillus sp.]